MTLLLHLLGCTPLLPIPAGIETLAGFDQPDACGDLDFVIDSANPQADGTDLGGILSVHVDGDPLATLADTVLAAGAAQQVDLSPEDYPLTMKWIEGSGRRNDSACPNSALAGSLGDSVTFDSATEDAYVILLPTAVEPSDVSDNCTVVTAIALVTGRNLSFVSNDDEHRDTGGPFTTVGVPVPCRP